VCDAVAARQPLHGFAGIALAPRYDIRACGRPQSHESSSYSKLSKYPGGKGLRPLTQALSLQRGAGTIAAKSYNG